MVFRWLKSKKNKSSDDSINELEGEVQCGADAERLAERYLSKKSFDILERNYSIPSGEIDIIARKDGMVVFVEIKYLSGRNGGYFPEEQVTVSKQRKIAKAALSYLQKNPSIEEVRFDVIAIEPSSRFQKYEIHHVENAFEVEI